MAIQTLGADNSTIAAVEAGHKALAVVPKPQKATSWLRIGGLAAATSTTLGAGSEVFQLRNGSGSTLILVRNVTVTTILSTAFTTAQRIDYGVAIARNWTVAGSGGTSWVPSGSQNLLRTSMSTPVSVDARITSGAALTAGTKTIDNVDLRVIAAWAGAVGNVFNDQPIFNYDDVGGYPIVLAQNEGIVIRTKTVWGAAGVATIGVNCEYLEVNLADYQG